MTPVTTREKDNQPPLLETPHATKPEPEQPPKPETETTKTAYPADFQKFWDAYPRQVGKRDALKAWEKAKKRSTTSNILDGARRLAKAPNRETRFTPYPARWLNRDGWEDEQTPAYQPQHEETRTFGTRPEDWLPELKTGTGATNQPPALYAVPQGDEP